MSGERKALALRITGRVQGVGYRAWLAGQAEAAALDGWVRNRRDGSVEALLSGPAEAVDQVAAACRRGPRVALVDRVQMTEAEPPDHPGFAQGPTL
ncbi:MAG: acylphosphatase [Inquilinus limosus]|uniref:acylphosphatase n=1 Tax=Inquilinus limosus TaxID=171674 RepID=A0A952FNC7_9PROT|nr:acylphosphatase [Inquilinus limosus]